MQRPSSTPPDASAASQSQPAPPVTTHPAAMMAAKVHTRGAGWLWLAALASRGVLLGRGLEKWL